MIQAQVNSTGTPPVQAMFGRLEATAIRERLHALMIALLSEAFGKLVGIVGRCAQM